ncbi:helix-turn-helix domain-containing protein [Bradyrhizobium diazoefficiens]|nr:helix-turn-helix domain-containing protein [Bradyrhizobium diazoefficiens]MBR0930633.1 helix-turn-helix domain-containing protein [Bradyrhizobium diazoefficiens]
MHELCANREFETLDQALLGLTSDAKRERQFVYAWKDALLQSFHLTPAEKHVATAIASFINMDPDNPGYGTGWASQKTIADRLKLTVRTVNSAFGRLRRLGLVVVEEGAGWKYANARTSTHRFALSSQGLGRFKSIEFFESRLLAAYELCAGGHSFGQTGTTWKRSTAREEIDAGMIGNPRREDENSFLTSRLNTLKDAETSLTTGLRTEYRILCILVGAEAGEEYGNSQLARLPSTLLPELLKLLACGEFTLSLFNRLLAHLRRLDHQRSG